MTNREQQIRYLVRETLGSAAAQVEADRRLGDPHDKIVDSLDFVEIMIALEERFEIEISDEEASELRTITAIVTYLDGRLGAQ